MESASFEFLYGIILSSKWNHMFVNFGNPLLRFPTTSSFSQNHCLFSFFLINFSAKQSTPKQASRIKLNNTLPKTNMEPENTPLKWRNISKPPIFWVPKLTCIPKMMGTWKMYFQLYHHGVILGIDMLNFGGCTKELTIF